MCACECVFVQRHFHENGNWSLFINKKIIDFLVCSLLTQTRARTPNESNDEFSATHRANQIKSEQSVIATSRVCSFSVCCVIFVVFVARG